MTIEERDRRVKELRIQFGNGEIDSKTLVDGVAAIVEEYDKSKNRGVYENPRL